LLAASALMHAYAGALCLKGSTASTICTFLSELIKKESTWNVLKQPFIGR